MKKSNKKIIICILVCLTFHLAFWPFAFKCAFGRVDSYITELVDIYIPNGIADEFKQYLSIDVDEYWIFELSTKEQNELLEDIEVKNWRVMDDTDILKLDYYTGFDSDNSIRQSIDNHKCYIYIFDCDNEIELPNDKGYFFGNNCAHWLVFIYDTVSNYYYVIHQSM